MGAGKRPIAIAVILIAPILTVVYISLVWRRARYGSGVKITSGKDILVPTILSWRVWSLIPYSKIRDVQIRVRGNSRYLLIRRFYASSLYLNANDFEDSDAIETLQRMLAKAEVGGTKFTVPLLSAVMSVAMLCLFLFSAHVGSPLHVESMLSLGAWYTPGLQPADAYRAISYAFLHKGWLHLVQNLLILCVLGVALEHVWPRARFLAVFFVASVAGAIASYFFYDFSIVIGASAGIYGLVGAYVFLRFCRLGRYEERFLSLSNLVLVFLIAIDFANAFMMRNVDIVAHTAGLAVGLMYAAFLDKFERSSVRFRWIDVAVLTISLGSLGQAAYMAATWNSKDTLKIAQKWMATGSMVAVNEGAWMVAVMAAPPKDVIADAIKKLQRMSLKPESKDTLATLYARSGDLQRAISIERAIVDHHATSALVSQLVRFERKFGSEISHNAGEIRGIAVKVPSSVDGVCNSNRFLQFNIKDTAHLGSVCPHNFELLSVHQGQRIRLNVKLDPRVLALPL